MAAQPKPRPRVPRPRTSSEPDVAFHPYPPRSNSEDSGLPPAVPSPPGAPVPKPRACWTTSNNITDGVSQSVRPLTHRVQSIPESELYGDDGPAAESTCENSDVFSAQEPALKKQVEQLRSVIAVLHNEEENLSHQVELKRRESTELDTRIQRLSVQEVTLNTKLTQLQEREREQEEKRSDGWIDERLRERELALQRREGEVSDCESANRQESLRLQRLADQLHMQKKDLDHREFDLQTYHDEGDRPSGRERAQLAERERAVQRMETDLASRERALDEMRVEFDMWKRQEEQSLQQRWSQLEQRERSLQSRMTAYNPTPTYPPYRQTAPQAPVHPPFIPHSTLPPQTHPYTPTFTQTQVPMQVPPNSPSHPHTPPQPQPQQQPQPQVPSQGGPGRNLFHGDFGHGGSQFSPGGYHYGPGVAQFGPGFSEDKAQSQHMKTIVAHGTTKPLVPNPGNPSLAVPIPYQNSGRQAMQYPQGSPVAPSPLNDLDSQPPHNDLDTPPLPPKPTGLSPTTRPNVIGDAVGTLGHGAVGSVGGAVGRTNVPTSTPRPQINVDEELAHHLSEFVPPAQTREQILSDEEYARQLQEQLNKAEPTESERDREYALALQTEEFPSGLPDLAQGEIGLQNTVKDKLKEQEEKKEQEKRDFQLAQELNDLGDGEPHQLNDLNL